MTFFFHRNFQAILLTLSLLVLNGSEAHSDPIVYSLQVSGKELGQVTIRQSGPSGGTRTLTQTLAIKAKSFWGKIDIKNQLEETISAKGDLLEASNRLRDGNKIYWTKIALSGNEYLAFRARMKNTHEKDLDDLGSLAKGAAAFLVPGAGDAFEVANLLLSDEKNQPKHDRFTRTSFDTTLMGLPLAWQRNNFNLPRQLVVFDTQEMTISKYLCEDLGEVPLPLQGRSSISTRHYRLSERSGRVTNIWLFRKSSGSAHFAQVSGKEDGEPFLIKMVTER